MSLKPEHQSELSKFTTYLKTKKEAGFKEADMLWDDFKTDNIMDQIYNKEDVEELCTKFYKDLKKVFNEEIDNVVNGAVNYVNVALNDAESNGYEIHVDVNYLDNQKIQESLKSFEKKGTMDLSKKNAQGSKLPSLNADGKMQDLQKEIDELKAKNQKLQADLIKNVKDKAGAGSFSKPEDDYIAQINELKGQILDYEKTCEELQTNMEKKLNESSQVVTMKKLMQQRNDQIKDLKKRLSKYEKVEETKNED